MIIIGLTGFKESGKDTAGKYLVEKYDFHRLSFAAPLKTSAGALFDIDPLMWEDLKNEDGAKVTLTLDGGTIAELTVRQFLQRYGTEAHRQVFGDNFWVEVLGLDEAGDDRYVITDTRFENEAAEVIRVGGTVVEIDRFGSTTDGHASEQRLPDHLIDETIDNTGTLQELYDRLDALVAPLIAAEDAALPGVAVRL